MGYVDKSLTPGERIILQARLSWAAFVNPVVFMALVVFAGFGLHLGEPICLIPFLLLGIAYFVLDAVAISTTEFAVTDKRIIAKTGLLRRGSLELTLEKVESIVVNQSLTGRIFIYGTIVVLGKRE